MLANINPKLSEFRMWLAGTHNRTGWEYIRRIRRSPVFGSIVFFPLLAAALTLGEKTQMILFFAFPVEITVRVHLLYWALFCLFLGTVLYTLFCPDMFVRYETRFDYAKSESEILKHPAFARRTLKFVEDRLRDLGPKIRPWNPIVVNQTELAASKMRHALFEKCITRVDDDLVAEFTSAHWSLMNRSYRFARAAINGLYHLGIILIGCVVALSICEVLSLYFCD